MREIELKFELDAEGRKRFALSPLLAGAPSQRHRMTSLYFDSAQCDVARAQMAPCWSFVW